MFFLIREVLEEVSQEELIGANEQYVVIVTSKQWETNKDRINFGMDFEPDTVEIYSTMAEVNYDSLTGAFYIPDRKDLSIKSKFAFVLNERGIIFIDDSGLVTEMVIDIQKTRRWRSPDIERFLHDFLDHITKDDLRIMERYERELDEIEQSMLNEETSLKSPRVNEIREDIRELLIHYGQLMDLCLEFEENENGFFEQDKIRYFRLILNRVSRLRDRAASLREYTMQILDMSKSYIDIRQNRIMTVLTVVTTIFMPLTLLVGWYGMNFKYMPELEYRWSYPLVLGACICIIVFSLLFFKKKKWI